MTEYKFLKRLEELNFHIINVEEVTTGYKGTAKSCSTSTQSHAVCVSINGQDKIVNWNFFNSDYRIYGCSKE